MTLSEEIRGLAQAARQAGRRLAVIGTEEKNRALEAMAASLEARAPEILQANALDVEAARKAGMNAALLDRLTLNEKRIRDMVRGVGEIRELPDPVGEVVQEEVRPNGMRVGRMRVPLGVIGIVYEARPNVTVDAAALCLKSGNAVLLRGGSDAIQSNRVLGRIVSEAIQSAGLPGAAVQVVSSTDREAVAELLSQTDDVDCIIPRGGKAFLDWVSGHSKVPVIRHGDGNCHVFVDSPADLAMAGEIVFNAKVQRPGVCNAAETLLVHAGAAQAFLPGMLERLSQAGVEIRGCERVRSLYPAAKAAVEADWQTEFLSLILAVKVVDNLDQALEHIAAYGSRHSEAIVTADYLHAERFLREVDAAAVLVNASTRLVDGGQFGLGAEIGISTQKLHARGPMGVRELTCLKFVVRGQGQVRR